MPVFNQGSILHAKPDSSGHSDGNANPLGIPNYGCPSHAKLTTYFVKRDRYDNYWVCGLYKAGEEQRLESYVVTQAELRHAVFPAQYVINAIREIDQRLARYLSQPLHI